MRGPGPPARLAASAYLGTNLWRGGGAACAATCRRRRRAARRRSRTPGSGAIVTLGRLYGPALGFTGAVRAGRPRRRPRAARPARRADSALARARHGLRCAAPSCSSPRAATRRRWRRPQELAAHAGADRQPRLAPWRSLEGAGAGRPGADARRRSSWRARSSSTRALRRARASSGRRCGCWARSSASEGVEHLREAVELLERSTARLELRVESALRCAARRGAAARAATAGRGARAAAARARAGRRCGAEPPRRAGARRAPRRRGRPRRERAHAASSRSRRASAGSRSSRPRAAQQGDRAGALRDAQDGRAPPLQRLPQARHPLAPRAGRGARRPPRGVPARETLGSRLGLPRCRAPLPPVDARRTSTEGATRMLTTDSPATSSTA